MWHSVYVGPGRQRFVLAAHAHLSLVLRTLPEACVFRPVAPAKMYMRYEPTCGLYLQRMLELEYDTNLNLALQQVFLDTRLCGRRVPHRSSSMEVAVARNMTGARGNNHSHGTTYWR